ncbi:MAG: hypothetical protein J6T80_05445 [Paludibacteraceae bacterium]|nr:hypothetical protein [Paludibacteraceae bacterium]
MKKVRSAINVFLGSLITALGLNSCERAVMYAPDPMYGPEYTDTTVHAMYGVNPNPIINWDENEEENQD